MSDVIRPATPADATAIARLRIDAWRTTYRGMIPDAYLDGMQLADSVAIWDRVLNAPPNRTSVFVAEDEQGLAGFAAGNPREPGPLGYDAELSAVYLRADRQRQGLGRRLVAAVAAAQHANGASSLVVWVIAGNRAARRFYEALGGELLVEQPFQWDGMDLVEAGYGFRDLDTLASASETAQLH
ncbi:MAG TPA: GNAT family N-acetyltransferase [Casimicrobiaceae bacterium]|nr:GNAT family N-acetyltransferase [Casimicrobiaceae bacterium]